jgi:PPOX class probable F420-dependent enzyme
MEEIPQPVVALLDSELVGWLTTVAPSGQPQSSAVWFTRDRRDVVVYSSPAATRMANLAVNPRVAFNLRGDPRGDTIVTVEGTTTIDTTMPPPGQNPAYLAKYADEIVRLFDSPAAYDAKFSTPLRVTINRLRHWG